jgi:hypothetical protein
MAHTEDPDFDPLYATSETLDGMFPPGGVHTPLDLLCVCRYPGLDNVKLLVEQGHDPFKPSTLGYTPFDMAISAGAVQVVRYFMTLPRVHVGTLAMDRATGSGSLAVFSCVSSAYAAEHGEENLAEYYRSWFRSRYTAFFDASGVIVAHALGRCRINMNELPELNVHHSVLCRFFACLWTPSPEQENGVLCVINGGMDMGLFFTDKQLNDAMRKRISCASDRCSYAAVTEFCRAGFANQLADVYTSMGRGVPRVLRLWCTNRHPIQQLARRVEAGLAEKIGPYVAADVARCLLAKQ